eukprot:8579428-Karenia_brevis.AAC.1
MGKASTPVGMPTKGMATKVSTPVGMATRGMATKGLATKDVEATTTKLVKEVPGEEEKPQMGKASTPVGMATKDAD